MAVVFRTLACFFRTGNPPWRNRANSVQQPLALLACFILITLLCSCGTGSGNGEADLQGRLSIKGSTAMLPLVTAAATLFEQQHPKTHIDVRGGGSIAGLYAIVNHQIDIGDSDFTADPAIFPDPNLTDHVLCIVPFVIVVSPEVTIASLSRRQVVSIFSTGTLRNWRQVDGPNLPIIPIVRPATSGTRAVFRQNVLEGRDEHGHLLTSDSSQAVRDAVAHTPGAIGYLALPFLDQSVRAIALDGQRPSVTSIETNRYAFWSYEHMYTIGEERPLAAGFISLLTSSEGHNLMQRLSYVPLPQLTALPGREQQAPVSWKAQSTGGQYS